MDRELERLSYGDMDRCPYRGNGCPLSPLVIPGEDDGCGNYRDCTIFVKLTADKRYDENGL
jgi:hypothetical protein